MELYGAPSTLKDPFTFLPARLRDHCIRYHGPANSDESAVSDAVVSSPAPTKKVPARSSKEQKNNSNDGVCPPSIAEETAQPKQTPPIYNQPEPEKIDNVGVENEAVPFEKDDYDEPECISQQQLVPPTVKSTLPKKSTFTTSLFYEKDLPTNVVCTLK